MPNSQRLRVTEIANKVTASSLSARLLVSVSLLLVIFFGITIAALELVFRDLSERSIRGLLDVQLIALIAASDMDENGRLQPSRQLAEPRFGQPGSGLYAQIRTPGGDILWRSPSLLGTQIELGGVVAPGTRQQVRKRLANGSEIMSLSAGFNWEINPGQNRNFVFSVATSLAPYEAQLQNFRVRLLGWFLGLMVLLLAALAILLRRLLRPLRKIEHEIREVEAGERSQLSPSAPRELVGLVANLNALLTSERRRVERYRNTLGNLAHSLKTPLAVVRTTLGELGQDNKSAVINEQIGRMDAIVQHQLKRAALGGTTIGQAAVEVTPVLGELRAALIKVYAHKDLSIEIEAGEGALFVGDRGDLLELAGNLLDNACKWCHGRVRVAVRRKPNETARLLLELVVEDDGKGIPAMDRQRILERGVRADEQTAGQGIGLSVVKEIVGLYAGRLEVGESDLGGARVAVLLPGR